jgi:hypothetical protein
MSAEPKAAGLEEIDDDQPGGYFLAFPRRFCFVAGTHIATLRGEMPVDQLREGDHIRAKKGSFHTVKDVMIADYDDLPPEAQAQVGLYPVKRGAVEEGLPRRDVYISAGQQFHLSRRLEIAHAVRMAVKKEGAALRGFRFVLFACPGLPMIRAEGVWTTLTPIERLFPMAPQEGQPGEAAEAPAHDAAPAGPPPEPQAPRPKSVAAARRAPELPPAPVRRPAESTPARRPAEPAPALVRPAPEPEAARPVSEPAPARRVPGTPVPARRVSQPADAAPELRTQRPATFAEGARRAGRRPPTRFLRTPLTIPGATDQTPPEA